MSRSGNGTESSLNVCILSRPNEAGLPNAKLTRIDISEDETSWPKEKVKKKLNTLVIRSSRRFTNAHTELLPPGLYSKSPRYTLAVELGSNSPGRI
jgi:hypothetical protein